MMDNLNFNYHDATLETIAFKNSKLELIIQLYPIYYPNHFKIKLVIDQITNIITCEKWISEVTSAFQEENEVSLSARIDAIYLDKNNKNQLLISIDSLKRVKLKFKYLEEISFI